MQYQAITFDGAVILFDQESLTTVEKNMRAKSTFSIKGKIVNGADLRRIEPYKEQGSNFGNGLSNEAAALFLDSGPKLGMGFWETIFRQNISRKRAGKPWLFKAAILAAQEDSHFVTPLELIAYPDEHWEEYKALNVPDNANPGYEAEVARLTRAFYQTDAGREYAAKMRRIAY